MALQHRCSTALRGIALLFAIACRTQQVSTARAEATGPSESVALALAAAPAPPPPVLEIHQINVQQGDCTLLVGPDGTTFLIDAGNVGKGTSEVVPYLASIGIQPSEGLDFMLATHGDQDHLGGLDEVIEAGYGVKQQVWNNGSTKSGDQIDEFVAATLNTPGGPVQEMPLGYVVQLGLGATATCVAVGGQVLGHGQVTGATNENDLSVAILVRFGSFEYLTAGDLGGGDSDRTCTGRSTDQADVETPLALSLMPGGAAALLTADGIEVLDVNHHGSESSTNRDTMNLLTPAVAVINTGPGQGPNFHHPRADVVENVLMAQAACITAAPALVLQTDEGDPPGSDTSFQGFCVGDVVIRTTGAGTFQLAATGRMKKGQDERAAAGIGASGRTFPLDGATLPPPSALVITEIMRDPSAVADTAGEWFELFNPGSAAVDIDGWTIRDDGNDSHLIAFGAPLFVPAGGYLVLGRNGAQAQNGGYVAGYVYSGFNLANGEDEIVLANAAGTVVDRVAYTASASWPSAAGRSMALADLAADNAVASNWVQATSRGGSFNSTGGSDLGTPGGPSPTP
ncbi:lamin tail domain-containing protein [Candidatus Berkelbacteria bacterium]|nr:lamin tail domain-containing protein [Candidatus Berkelbacteria bacterium]